MYDTIKTKLIEREAEFKKQEEVLFERSQACESLVEQIQNFEKQLAVRQAESQLEQQRLIDTGYDREKLHR